ncbi:hypothetical protein X907_1828 [Glycocaulis alkaliphilus]|uniref:Uncharacterized protein n=1 Tax=Glycocaulis alkaliphilus TaxID=1434191 RepID=A0A3T0EAW8_9PROT|nr:hypothetical protein X907_1828 [Glycocaulis alkaliphilus]
MARLQALGSRALIPSLVIPAKAGTQPFFKKNWVPDKR